MTRRAPILAAVVTLAVTPWLAMVVHESGHVLAALATGGHVIAVDLAPWRFSSTAVEPNPHPLAVVWAGPLWGAIAPLVVFLLARVLRWRVVRPLAFFAGFCLVGNGAYLALGWMNRAGDAGDLLRFGVPVSVLIGAGSVAIIAGFACWHTLGSLRQLFQTRDRR